MILVPLKTVSGMNARLRLIMSYDPDTGVFIRTAKSGQNVVVGSEAGTLDKQGYRRIRFDGRTHQAHRLAWLYVYGEWPNGRIDHINGNRADNRITNLRVVDHSTNLENQRRARSDNRIGVLGVRPMSGRFQARIWVKGRAQTVGTFDTADEAGAAYIEAKRRLHAGCTL